MALAYRLATERNEKPDGVPNRRIAGRHSDWELNYAGVRGEIAVAQYFGVPIDERFYAYGDGKAPDLRVGRWGVEVKTAFYSPPILKLPSVDALRSDWLVICYVRENGDRYANRVDLAGAVSRKRFCLDCYRRDFGYGSTFCFDATEMLSVRELREIVSRTLP